MWPPHDGHLLLRVVNQPIRIGLESCHRSLRHVRQIFEIQNLAPHICHGNGHTLNTIRTFQFCGRLDRRPKCIRQFFDHFVFDEIYLVHRSVIVDFEVEIVRWKVAHRVDVASMDCFHPILCVYRKMKIICKYFLCFMSLYFMLYVCT